MSIVEIIMSSAVVAAIIGWLRGNKEDQLNYITGERSTWRKELKECIEGFQTCRIEELDHWLIKLKVNLNGYGCHDSGEYPEDMYLNIFRDEHIWKLIDALEAEQKKSNYSKQRIQVIKKQIIQLILILLKFDWERSKREVKTNKLLIIACGIMGLYVLIVCYFIYAYLHKTVMNEEWVFNICLTTAGVILFFYFIAWIPIIIDRMEELSRTGKWYRKVMTPFFCWMIGAIGECFIWCVLIILLNNAVLVISYFMLLLSFQIPAYQLRRSHSPYIEYDQAVMGILKMNTLIVYGGGEDVVTNRAMETFLNKGVIYGVEKDLKIFLQDEEFKKFIEETPVKSILLPAGRKKYKKIK